MPISREVRLNEMHRSIVLFENSCRSLETLKSYRYYLTKFLEFTKIRDYDSLVKVNPNFLQEILENYLFYLKKKGIKRKTIENYFAGVECFLDANKIIYHKKSIHKMFPADSKHGNDKPYSTSDIQKFLSSTTSKRNKALILFFSSIGGRPGALLDPVLRFRHFYPMPLGCKAVLIYEDAMEEYWAFLTPESAEAIDDYKNERINNGEKIVPDSPVFRNDTRIHKVRPITYQSMVSVMRVIVRRAGIERIKKGERYDKAIFYGFRKRFNTILKINNDINSNIAEKLMAHNRGLDGAYLKPTREECFNEFVKAIPDLMINDTSRLQEKLRLEKESKEKDDYEKEIRIFNLEKNLKDVYQLLKQIQKK